MDKDSLSPQEIRKRVMDVNPEFQKRMVEYLEGASKGEFYTATLQEMEEYKRSLDTVNPQRIQLSEQLPDRPIDPCPDECKNCTQCNKSSQWWTKYYKEVDELIVSHNVHDCRKNLKCKKSKNGCTARFPRELFSETTFDPETGKINQRKGESMLNNFSPVVSFIMRCNHDVTSLLSGTAIKAVIAYVTDYITKPGLKTHTIFEAVKSVFKRESDIINGDLEKLTKAKKLVVKIVNSLIARSEIGGPMASMYLLKHKDHYTSHTFIPFYWNTYVREAMKVWPALAVDQKDGKTDKIKIDKKENVFIALNKYDDYIHRPKEFEDIPLYDWVRCMQKRKMKGCKTKKIIKIKENEYQVDYVENHRWINTAKRQRVEFKVKWTAGDTTWQSYSDCKQLAALDDYFKLFNVSRWQELPTEFTEARPELNGNNDADIDSTSSSSWCRFTDCHPQKDTHEVSMKKNDQYLVPDFIGGAIPRRDTGIREVYCSTMLIFFKPWRSGKDLKGEEDTWDLAFTTYEFTDRQNSIMNNFQLRYECNDARDDYHAQRKQKGLALNDDITAGYTGYAEYMNQEENGAESYPDDDLAYTIPDPADLDTSEILRMQRAADASEVLTQAGALEIIPGYENQFQNLPSIDCELHSSSHWSSLLENKKTEILKQREHQAAAKGVDKNTKNSKESVKIVSREYIDKDFKPESSDDLILINNTVEEFSLNSEQERAFRIVANHAVLQSGEQLKMYLGGMAGTRKSQVIKALRHLFEKKTREL